MFQPRRLVCRFPQYVFLLFLLYCFAPAQKLDFKDDPNLVHFGDTVDVDVVGSFEFDWRGGLNDEGYLDGLNSFGKPIYGLCRSELQIAVDYAAELASILRSPEVVVRIIDRSGRPEARIEGAVRTPTRFRINRAVRLLELIVMAGGITDEAGGEISILRPVTNSCEPRRAGSAPQIVKIRMDELLAGSEAANPQILSGDLINILRAPPVYVIGGVRSPRPIASRERLTLSRAVAIAGGLLKDSADEVTIFRKSPGGSQAIRASFSGIASGAEKDVELQPYDVVDVALNGRERRVVPPAVVPAMTPGAERLPLRIVD
jgi:polysaccharide export outer membrane protein